MYNNCLGAKMFWGNINICSHFCLFLTEMLMVGEIHPHRRQGPIYLTHVNTADNLVTQGTSLSAVLVQTQFSWNIVSSSSKVFIRSQVKTRQSQSYKFKKIAKNSNLEILQDTLQGTHLLRLLDKMYKYEKDPTRTVGPTDGITFPQQWA